MSTKRDQLLQAAQQIVAGKGVIHLTLDAVAQQAGVSKGGLLYHFPNKEALIAAMMETYITHFNARIQTLLDEQLPPDMPGRWLQAFVIATFEDFQGDLSGVLAGLAAVANQPDLLQPLKTTHQGWRQTALDEGTPPTLVDVVIAATDGVWYSYIFGFSTFSDADYARLRQQLLDMIQKGVADV